MVQEEVPEIISEVSCLTEITPEDTTVQAIATSTL
jgi:hypothetical protein